MKTIFENVIERGGYDLTGLLNRIDSYHVMGKLTDAERDELYAKARATFARRDGYTMGATGQNLKNWATNSWWFTQYSGD